MKFSFLFPYAFVGSGTYIPTNFTVVLDAFSVNWETRIFPEGRDAPKFWFGYYTVNHQYLWELREKAEAEGGEDLGWNSLSWTRTTASYWKEEVPKTSMRLDELAEILRKPIAFLASTEFFKEYAFFNWMVRLLRQSEALEQTFNHELFEGYFLYHYEDLLKTASQMGLGSWASKLPRRIALIPTNYNYIIKLEWDDGQEVLFHLREIEITGHSTAEVGAEAEIKVGGKGWKKEIKVQVENDIIPGDDIVELQQIHIALLTAELWAKLIKTTVGELK